MQAGAAQAHRPSRLPLTPLATILASTGVSFPICQNFEKTATHTLLARALTLMYSSTLEDTRQQSTFLLASYHLCWTPTQKQRYFAMLFQIPLLGFLCTHIYLEACKSRGDTNSRSVAGDFDGER